MRQEVRLRSSLAAVILRMAGLDLGSVDAFPFLEPPSSRAIADGYQLLQELTIYPDAGDEWVRVREQVLRLRFYLTSVRRAFQQQNAALIESAGYSVRDYPSAEQFLADDDASGECLIADIKMPGMSGLELQEKLTESGKTIPVIVVTGSGDVPLAVRAMKAGAIDFIEKPFDYKRVVALVEECLKRDAAARADRERRRATAERLAQLTQREREVLELIVAGKLNREIAEMLDISIKTVEAHRAKVMEKLEVSSVAELVQATLGAGAAARDPT